MGFRRIVNSLAIAILLLSVARLMTRNRSRAALPPPTADPLSARVPAMHFASANLLECISELSRATGARIELDSAIGNPNYTIDLDVPPSTLRKDLASLFSSCSITSAAYFDGKRIRVVPVGLQPHTLRVYDVRDLWQKITEEMWEEELHGKPSAGGNSQQGLFGGSYSGGGGVWPAHSPADLAATKADAMDAITRCVQSCVTPDEWADAGGFAAAIRGSSGYLIIYHTPGAHREIEELLRAFRAADRIHWADSDRSGTN